MVHVVVLIGVAVGVGVEQPFIDSIPRPRPRLDDEDGVDGGDGGDGGVDGGDDRGRCLLKRRRVSSFMLQASSGSAAPAVDLNRDLGFDRDHLPWRLLLRARDPERIRHAMDAIIPTHHY